MTRRFDYSAAAPEGMKALAGVYGYVARCGLAKTLIELAYLRASQINGCAYCIGLHSRALLDEGVAVEKLFLVPAWREAESLFSPRERAALAWTEAVTKPGETNVTDAVFEEARQQFDEKELTDLSIAIGLMNIYNRLAISSRKPPDAAVV